MRRISRHKNGLTVVTSEMPHMASVSVGIWVGVGGRHEPVDVCGVSHFIEHLLFKGTKHRNALRISQDVEGIGGYLNAFTSEENTCFYSKAKHDCFPELFDVLCDMFLNSKFAPPEIEKERNVIKEELAMYLDQPQHHVQELLNETLWPDQPLGRSLTGTEKSLDAITRSQLLAYQRSNYVSEGTLIAAAGNLSHEKIMKTVSRLGGMFPHGKRPQFVPVKVSQRAPAIRLYTKETEQTQIALGIRTCSRHDERRYPLRLLSTILGENMSSRLFQVIREDHGLAYSISSSLSFFDDVGVLTISAGLDTGKIEKTLELIMIELRKLVRNPPSSGELKRARDYVIGQLDLGLESTENQMMWLGEHMLGYDKLINPTEIKDRLNEITASQIKAVAKDFFTSDRLNMALVTPLKEDRGISKLFRL